jgi:plasmid stabilization system protein ParE
MILCEGVTIELPTVDGGSTAKLDAAITRCVERLTAKEFDGPFHGLRSGAFVRRWGVPPFRIYYQRHPDGLLILRVYHQKRRPIAR